jgi:hypothetical protein
MQKLPWRWWSTVALAVTQLVIIYISFTWIIGWTDAGNRYFVYLEHGMLCGNPDLGRLAGGLPWYGMFRIFQSGVYVPWTFFPEFNLARSSFRFPLHLIVIVLLPILVYPFLPFATRRYRRKHGLCLHCGYDLTGNISGVCPECGTAINADS